MILQTCTSEPHTEAFWLDWNRRSSSSHDKVYRNIFWCTTLDTSSVLFPGVLQQTPSSWRPDRGWSDPGLCPSGILLPPLLSPLQPEPSGSFFCCLHVVAYGSSSVSTCYACRPCSGSDWQIPCCPPLLAYTWSSIRSSDNPPPVLGISPSFSLEPPPSSPPGHCQLQQD